MTVRSSSSAIFCGAYIDRIPYFAIMFCLDVRVECRVAQIGFAARADVIAAVFVFSCPACAFFLGFAFALVLLVLALLAVHYPPLIIDEL